MLCDEAEPQGERKGKVTESIYLICSVYTVYPVFFLWFFSLPVVWLLHRSQALPALLLFFDTRTFSVPSGLS